MNRKVNNKIDAALIASIILLVVGLVALVSYNHVLQSDIKEQKQELSSLAKKKESQEEIILEQKKEITKAQEQVTKDLTGFLPDDLENDVAILRSYLENIFVWENGDQYDKQREIIKGVNADGTEELLKTVMTTNYRVSVPDELKGTIKDNDIDINGLKSALVEAQINRMSWDKTTTADVTYTARVQYQIYINESDLEGEYKTLGNLLFTIKLSGVGKDRKVVDVKFAFIQ